ncbi:MAG: glycosyltransferase family 2 protein [Planctomycetaceae bacterium]|nr:glycosyltransferase family 2 protein [Planctomycetaceae bacterium]
MNLLELGQSFLVTVYTLALVVVSMYGLHRWVLVILYFRHRKNVPTPPSTFDPLPRVTVQLPMFNESLVAQRIIEQTCLIDYPRDRMEIQVLDDSTDETTEICRRTVESCRARGFDVSFVHRTNRQGYKAGALENGLKSATGEFVTIFDADFIPPPDILQRSVHYFTDPKVCVVQTRWEHLNRNDSLLTRSQAMFLDGHFMIEHVARNRSDRFMSFNGTAGTWRRKAIEDAGGWRNDTLTEDLDLSYRAQLKGWKFVFLPELASPAELPPEMDAFKAQQFRWTKGGAQTALKMLPRLLLSKAPLKVKIEGFFHLTGFTLHFYMALLVLLLFPAACVRASAHGEVNVWLTLFDMTVFTLATLSATVFYAASQFQLFRDWRTAFKFMPMLMALGVGMCISNTKAIFEAVLGKRSEFVRTPKYGCSSANGGGVTTGGVRPKRKNHWLPYVEMGFGIYLGACALLSMASVWGLLGSPFLVIFAFGFFYVSVLSFQARREPVGTVASEPVASRQ